jgi:hypothetical protein
MTFNEIIRNDLNKFLILFTNFAIISPLLLLLFDLQLLKNYKLNVNILYNILINKLKLIKKNIIKQ